MSALPPIDAARMPAEVRNAPAPDRDLYRGALAFEEQLTQQLMASVADAATSGDDGEDGSDPVAAQTLPSALTQGVTAGGGIGLALPLWRMLRRGAA